MKKIFNLEGGFTLVELLAVIVILGLIVTVAIPSTQAISAKIKERMYNTKIELAESAALLWVQNKKNQKCLVVDKDKRPEYCSDDDSYGCESDDNCFLTLKFLADEGYIDYDQDFDVIDPRNKTSMNDDRIDLIYDNNNDKFYLNK